MPESNAKSIHVLAIPGSLREGSYNKGLLRAAQEEAPEAMTVEMFEIGEIPFFNQDVEDRGDPEPVRRLKEAIRQADAVLIATPEYQHGLPGVLKNALDWASRPPESPMNEKVVGMMGASPGPVGTARAHLQLRQTLTYNRSRMVARPEVLVAGADEKFDEDGRFTDEEGRKFIRRHLEALAEEVHRDRRENAEAA